MLRIVKIYARPISSDDWEWIQFEVVAHDATDAMFRGLSAARGAGYTTKAAIVRDA